MQSNQNIVSVEYTFSGEDSRCRYWGKVLEVDQPLPQPEAVSGASDIPSEYVRRGDTLTLFEGDVVIEGEENHHRKKRGWSYRLGIVQANGEIQWDPMSNFQAKAALKASGEKDLMKGRGDIAHCIRVLHCIRMGLTS